MHLIYSMNTPIKWTWLQILAISLGSIMGMTIVIVMATALYIQTNIGNLLALNTLIDYVQNLFRTVAQERVETTVERKNSDKENKIVSYSLEKEDKPTNEVVVRLSRNVTPVPETKSSPVIYVAMTHEEQRLSDMYEDENPEGQRQVRILNKRSPVPEVIGDTYEEAFESATNKLRMLREKSPFRAVRVRARSPFQTFKK